MLQFRALGFRWGLPYLLPTPLSIPGEVSRVHNVGLKQDDLGGVLLTAPSALCGFPDITPGRSGLPEYPLVSEEYCSHLDRTSITCS